MFAVTGAAWAQESPPPDSPARQCADAASGTEVEVCLRLAAEHPDAVDELTAALVARVDRVEGPDRALLEALILLSSGSAAEGCRRLALTQDPRAEALLVNTVRVHRDEEVRSAAVLALASFPGALPELAGWMRDRTLPLAVRLTAVEAVSRVPGEDSHQALLDAALRPGLSPTLQKAVVRVLERGWPDVDLEHLDLPPSENGAVWLATGASVSLGYALATAGWFGRTQRWEVGAVTGATAGATAGWIYGRAWPLEAGDAGLVATSGALGTGAGYLVGFGLSDGNTSTAFLAGLAGDAVGLAGGAVATPFHPGTGADAAEASVLAAIVGGAAGAGAAASGADRHQVALASGLGLAGGTVLGHLASPGFSTPADLRPILVGSALGLAGSALVRTEDPALAALAGGLGGAAVGGLVGGWAEPPPDLLVGAVSGAALGGALGAGGALAGGASPGLRTALGIGGGSLGLLTGTAYALIDPEPIDDRDAVLTGVAAVWSGFNAVAITQLASTEPDRATGVVLVSAASAGLLTTAFNLQLDVPVPQTLCASSLGIWGGYVGYQTGELAGVDPLLTSLGGADLGLLLGGVLVSPVVGVPPLVLGVADAGGVFGGAAGALVAGLATDDRDAVTTSSLVGAGVGGAIGLGVGVVWHRSQGRRDVVRLPTELPPIAFAPGPTPLGVSLRVGPW